MINIRFNVCFQFHYTEEKIKPSLFSFRLSQQNLHTIVIITHPGGQQCIRVSNYFWDTLVPPVAKLYLHNSYFLFKYH